MGYECLLAGLPELKAGGEKAPHGTTSSVGDPAAPMSMEALLELFSETLLEKDLALLSMLRMPSDAPEVLAEPPWSLEPLHQPLSQVNLLINIRIPYILCLMLFRGSDALALVQRYS